MKALFSFFGISAILALGLVSQEGWGKLDHATGIRIKNKFDVYPSAGVPCSDKAFDGGSKCFTGLKYCLIDHVWASLKGTKNYICRPATEVFWFTGDKNLEAQTKVDQFYETHDPEGHDAYRTHMRETPDGSSVPLVKEGAASKEEPFDLEERKKQHADTIKKETKLNEQQNQEGRSVVELHSNSVMDKYEEWKSIRGELEKAEKVSKLPGSSREFNRDTIDDIKRRENAAADSLGAAIRTARTGSNAPERLTPDAERAIADFSNVQQSKWTENNVSNTPGGNAGAEGSTTAGSSGIGTGGVSQAGGSPSDRSNEWYGFAPPSKENAQTNEPERKFGDNDSAITREGGRNKEWSDGVNSSDECGYSGRINARNGTLCKATKGFVQGSEIANAAGQAIGATAVTAVGDREAQRILKQEIENGQNGQAMVLQAASYDAAAATAKATADKELGLAITNTVLGATSTSLAITHGSIAGKMKKAGPLEKSFASSNIRTNKEKVWTKDGALKEQEVIAERGGKAGNRVGETIYREFDLDSSYNVALVHKNCEQILQNKGAGANPKDYQLCKQAQETQDASIDGKRKHIDREVKRIGGRAGDEQGGMAVVATLGAVKSLSQATAGYINRKTALEMKKNYEEIARKLREQANANQQNVEFEWDPGDEGGENLPGPPVTPGDGDPGFGGAEEAALSEEPDFGVGNDPNFDPDVVAQGPPAGSFNQGTGPRGGGPGLPGLPGGGAMGNEGAAKEGESEAQANAKESGMYASGGAGGGYGSRGGSDGVGNGGINLAGIMGQLADLVGGKKEDPKSGEYQFEGDRAVSNYSPLLGANTDIFQRITTRYREKTREGVFNPRKL